MAPIFYCLKKVPRFKKKYKAYESMYFHEIKNQQKNINQQTSIIVYKILITINVY